jgi:hypothetical protein
MTTQLRRPEVRLFLTATSLLFVELLLIRWIPANVIYVGYFRNFLLMASFLGIGLGILWGRDPNRISVSPFGPLLLGLVILVTQFRVSIELTSPGEVFFGLTDSKGADINFFVLPGLVLITTMIMAGLAVPLGGLLRSMPPLRAYSLDIVGCGRDRSSRRFPSPPWSCSWRWRLPPARPGRPTTASTTTTRTG